MKLSKYLIPVIVALFLLSSCATYNAPTKYQGRNLYKFTSKKRTNKVGKARTVKYIALKKRGSYIHRAVPFMVRREIRQRSWSDNSGGGTLYK